jgi:hypothetical protein
MPKPQVSTDLFIIVLKYQDNENIYKNSIT